MESKENDFVVDTREHCFLCLNQIKLISKPIHYNYNEKHVPISIQYLSKYLKLDMRKVFQGPVPHHLLEKVERSRLKVELCLECSNLNEKLTKLFEHRERIEMEIKFRLNTILDKISYSDELGKMERIRNQLENYNLGLNSGDLLGKLEIAQVLRKEMERKCSTKLTKSDLIPVVRIKKTKWKKPTVKVKENKHGKGQETFENIPVSINNVIKVENSPCPSVVDNNSDNDFLEFDDNIPQVDDGLENSSSTLDSYSLSETGAVKEETVKIERNVKSKATSFPTLNKFKGKFVVIGSSKNLAKIPPSIQSTGIFKLDPAEIAGRKAINPENGKHQCRICLKEYGYKRGLLAHFKSAHMNVSFTCPAPSCRKCFGRNDSYERHYETIHLGFRRQCKVCKKSFFDNSTLSRHVKNAHK